MSSIATEQFNQDVGARLAAARKAQGMSQSAFAATLGLSLRAYANYERGEREIATAVVNNLLVHYDIDPVWLLAGSSDAPEYVVHRKLNTGYLVDVIETIKAELQRANLTLSSKKHAKLIFAAYTQAIDQREVSASRIRDLVRLLT